VIFSAEDYLQLAFLVKWFISKFDTQMDLAEMNVDAVGRYIVTISTPKTSHDFCVNNTA